MSFGVIFFLRFLALLHGQPSDFFHAFVALMVDANVLAVRREVADAYWNLWLIHEVERLSLDHDAVIEAMAGAVRGRLQIGSATLADLNQVDLNIARHHDHKGNHEQAAHKASAKLRAALGAAAASGSISIAQELAIGQEQLTSAAHEDLAELRPLAIDAIKTGLTDESTAMQLRAATEGIELLAVYEDFAISGEAALADRRGLQEAIAAARELGAGKLVAVKRDRFALHRHTIADVERAASRAGAVLVTTDGVCTGEDTESAEVNASIQDLVAALWLQAQGRRRPW